MNTALPTKNLERGFQHRAGAHTQRGNPPSGRSVRQRGGGPLQHTPHEEQSSADLQVSVLESEVRADVPLLQNAGYQFNTTHHVLTQVLQASSPAAGDADDCLAQ